MSPLATTQGIAILTFLVCAALFSGHLVTRGMGVDAKVTPLHARLAFIALLVVLMLALGGCASGRHLELPPAPQDAAQKAACPPLPVCDIPPGANSTQLELALWKCVLDYRAMYSVCFHMVNSGASDSRVTE